MHQKMKTHKPIKRGETYRITLTFKKDILVLEILKKNVSNSQ